jgi:two-component system, NarL family, response regulator DevR
MPASRQRGKPEWRHVPATDPPPVARPWEYGLGTGHSEGAIRVFVVDDHEIVRRGLRDILEAEGDIVVAGESGSAKEAARRVPAVRPHVAVLDERLPDGSGVELFREIRAVDSSILGLILTSYDDDEALFAAIMAGASGYVLKHIAGTELVDAVRRVTAGQSLIDPVLMHRVLARVRRAPSHPELNALSERERKVLALIPEGLTNRQIAERMQLSEKTVKNHISHILSKLGLERRTQAAILAAKLLR